MHLKMGADRPLDDRNEFAHKVHSLKKVAGSK